VDLQNVKKKVSVFRAHGHKACMYIYNHDSHLKDEGVPPFPFSSMSSTIVEHNGWDEFSHLANRCYA
jgi:hypothetical protein